jgi:SH3 domain protein
MRRSVDCDKKKILTTRAFIQQNTTFAGGFQSAETAANSKRPADRTPPFTADGAPKESIATMKRICLAMFLILMLTTASAAQDETAYITDTFEVTLRTGPGIDHKIVAMLRSGQSVSVIEEGEEWTQVELSDGRQGYVLGRFLSQSPPARTALDRVQGAYEQLQRRAESLAAENDLMRSENQTLEARLEKVRAELAQVQEQYTTLKTESADFFTLKTRYERAAASLRQSTERVQQLEAEVSRLELKKNVRWFLSGAGVLVLGFLIGFSAKKQRRRSSLL